MTGSRPLLGPCFHTAQTNHLVSHRFDAWIRSVDHYTGNDLLYLNPKGIIPANAVIKRNERREKPFREKRRFDATSFPEGKQPAIDVEDEEDEEEEEEKLDKNTLVEMEG